MSKVWVVLWFSSEPYSDYSGVDSVHSSKKSAYKRYEEGKGKELFWYEDDYEGYYLSKPEEFNLVENC